MILVILFITSYTEGKNKQDERTNIEKIDSIFTKHLSSIENYIIADTGKYCISNSEDNEFLFLVGFLTGREYEFQTPSFTMLIMLDRSELEEIKKWYKDSRKRLNYEKI